MKKLLSVSASVMALAILFFMPGVGYADECGDGEIPCTCNGAESCVTSVQECWDSCIAIRANTPLEEIMVVPATPEGRQQLWQKSFLEFADQHQEISHAQEEAIWAAVRLVEPRYFAEELGVEERHALEQTLENFVDVFSVSDYVGVLSGVKGLQGWMVKNEVIEPIALGGTCNCNSDGDCASGFTCQSIGCTVQPGSNSWGVCSGGGGVVLE